MDLAFKTVAVIARSDDASISETLTAVLSYCHAQNIDVFSDAESRQLCETCFSDTQIIPREQLGGRCDLMICVGGDGNLLHASHLAIEHGTPVVGVNRGRLGFLTDIKPQDLAKIGDILAGDYLSEQRHLITAQIERNGSIVHEEIALNDAVLHPGKVAHMIEFEIYINQEFVCSTRADGLIVSTPTGSTAYALSGGGPIVHPKLDALLLVPMFPHTLNYRPLVINNSDALDIVLADHKNELFARFSCDGSPETILKPNDRIKIRKHPKSLQLIHPKDYSYYETLRAKLHWGTKLVIDQ